MVVKTNCRCGAALEYAEEIYSNVCWCCAVYQGRDIGARYYYATGIWSKYPKRKFRKDETQNEKFNNSSSSKPSTPIA